MKRLSHLLLGLAMLAALLVPAAVSAQGLTYGSSWQVQNLENEGGALTIMFYGQDGEIIPGATIANDSIAANGSKTYFAVQNPNLPTPFQGSAVIAADRELRVITNLYANNAQGVLYAASSAGYTQGATEINLPLVMRNNGGYSTWFSIQNAGMEPTEVEVDFFYGTAGNDFSPDPVVIKPGGAVVFDQAPMADLGSRFVGAAVIKSDGEPIVATLVAVGGTNMMAYDGFGMETELVASVGSEDFVAPLYHYWNGADRAWYSGVQVQNLGEETTEVTLEFVPESAPNSGTYCTETLTINPGASETFGTYSFYSASHPSAGVSTCWANNHNPVTNQGTRFVGSVGVLVNSTGQPLNAVVTQNNPPARKGSAYSAFIPEEATRCLAAPLIMDRNRGYETSLTIYNEGDVQASVAITYTRTTGAVQVHNTTIPAKTSKVIYNMNNLGNEWVGSAKACGQEGAKLLAIVNEIKHAEYGDSMYTYNAFNLAEPIEE